jgi:glycosyltransferase involved in cell wall biosynthesis
MSYKQKIISIIIPVHNEKGRLEEILKKLNDYADVIVVDDFSDIPVSSYIESENYSNLTLLSNNKQEGYIASIKKGIFVSRGDIVVTMDGDGEHKPEDIPLLLSPITKYKCDIVFGKRPNIARPSEVFLLKIAKFLTGEKVEDSGTGFRAIRTSFAKDLYFYGSCTCGTLLQECHNKNMKICEVKVDLPLVDKPRKIAWDHVSQFFSIWKYYFTGSTFPKV